MYNTFLYICKGKLDMTPTEFRRLRKAAGMTQAEMARHVDKSRVTIINWEAGTYAIPDGVLDTLANKGLSLEPKETAKQQRDREAYEKSIIDYWVSNYRRLRAWPHAGNHTKAMAVYASEGTVIPTIAYAAIVAEFPDILTDPNGDYTMTKEQSRSTILTPNHKE